MMNLHRQLLPLCLGFFFAFGAKHASATTEEPKIEITSIQFPEPRNRTAEICGKVTNAKLPAFVRLEVDYTMDKPAIYNVLVGQDGLFCLVAVTLRGKIRASLFGTPPVTPSEN